MHYQRFLLSTVPEKMAKLKTMHMFTRSLMCMQNTEEIQLKLREELITKVCTINHYL